MSHFLRFLFIAAFFATGCAHSDTQGLELPYYDSAETVLHYSGFTVCYDTNNLIPKWVAYELTAEETTGDVKRQGGFSMDPHYHRRQAMREDYSNSGWDKGHMAPAGDMKWSETAMHESFYLTNVCPQNHDLNGKDWQKLENSCRKWAQRFGKVYIVCGPIIGKNKYGTIGERQVAVPDAFFKAVLANDGVAWHSIAFIMQNDSSSQPMNKSCCSIDDLEYITGLDLFHNLDDGLEATVEQSSSLLIWK